MLDDVYRRQVNFKQIVDEKLKHVVRDLNMLGDDLVVKLDDRVTVVETELDKTRKELEDANERYNARFKRIRAAMCDDA